MTFNITSLPQKHPNDQQSLLKSGDRVYLYGDRTYRGTVIHPVEHTYPYSRVPLRLTATRGRSPKWTVQLDRGGYEAVNIKQIDFIESRNNEHFVKEENNYYESDLELPFSDSLDESDTSTSELEREIASLKRENALLQQQQRELKQENQLLKKDLEQAKQIIRRAKDISPVMRLSLKRVLRLAHDACMDVQRTVGGWILRMGDKARKFRRLADIWDLISVDEFVLSEIFPEEKLIAVELIVSSKRKTRPEPMSKKTFPLMRPEDIMRNRRMLLVKSS